MARFTVPLIFCILHLVKVVLAATPPFYPSIRGRTFNHNDENQDKLAKSAHTRSDKEKSESSASIGKRRESKTEELKLMCDKPCPDEFRPNCGSDGKVYNNNCLFEIAECKNASLTLESFGEDCINASTDEADACAMACLETWDPVCASNGDIYSNRCALEVEQCKQSHKGAEPMTEMPLFLCQKGDETQSIGETGALSDGNDEALIKDNLQYIEEPIQGVAVLGNDNSSSVVNTRDNVDGQGVLLEAGALLSMVVEELAKAPAKNLAVVSENGSVATTKGEINAGGAGDVISASPVTPSWASLVDTFKNSDFHMFKSRPCPVGCLAYTDGCNFCDCNANRELVNCTDVQCVWQGIPKCIEWENGNVSG